jgi:hypothetical protein
LNQRRIARALLGTALAAIALCSQAVHSYAAPTAPAGKTRTYYVAADEVQWDYAPS